MKASEMLTVPSVISFISQATDKQIRDLKKRLEELGWKLEPLYPSPDPQPSWDKKTLTIRYGDHTERQWRALAKNQISILDAFQKFQWTRQRIDYGQYLFELRGQKMHDTLYRLRRDLKGVLFHYSGKRPRASDEWVSWEPRTLSASEKQ